MENIVWKKNRFKGSASTLLEAKDMNDTLRYHQTLPGYSVTPLISLSNLAKDLGVQNILVKDESFRFGLNAFKVLGSSYALARILAKKINLDLAQITFADLKEAAKNMRPLVFASATSGNHGRGLAWSTKLFNQKSVIYLPKCSSPIRLQKLLDLGTQAEITNMSYDDTVRQVSKLADEKGWILVQDTAWQGYEEIPKLIMKGYLTIVAEILNQMSEMKMEAPTHVILQAGVGSFAAAIAECLQQHIKTPMKIIIVEPTQADCFFQSACSTDGTSQKSKGSLSTMMAGLCCAEPSPIAWELLKKLADCFVTCPDTIAANGMRTLGNPIGNDRRIISGESGAVPLGLLFEICRDTALLRMKQDLNIDATSRILMISTEGDTDPDNYRKICWG